jgi:hypothetical protein
MCLIGDLAHHSVLLLERPRSDFIYDLDHQAGEARVQILGMLSKQKIAIYGGHFPWPGIGHVAAEKEEFKYFPEATEWVSLTN